MTKHSTDRKLESDPPAMNMDNMDTRDVEGELLHYYGGIPNASITAVSFRDEQGQYHRFDGPAITWTDGYVEYWIHGKKVSKEYVNFLNKRREHALNQILVPELSEHILSFL